MHASAAIIAISEKSSPSPCLTLSRRPAQEARRNIGGQRRWQPDAPIMIRFRCCRRERSRRSTPTRTPGAEGEASPIVFAKPVQSSPQAQSAPPCRPPLEPRLPSRRLASAERTGSRRRPSFLKCGTASVVADPGPCRAPQPYDIIGSETRKIMSGLICEKKEPRVMETRRAKPEIARPVGEIFRPESRMVFALLIVGRPGTNSRQPALMCHMSARNARALTEPASPFRRPSRPTVRFSLPCRIPVPSAGSVPRPPQR